MRFAHIADCHIGGWNEPKMKELGIEAFSKAVSICIEQKLDFVLIAGDLFNTALPQIELIKEATAELKKLKDNNIPVYIVAGSHDFSPSGKTMLDVLEKAGLLINVSKLENNRLEFTTDKTGAKITGMPGKKGGLEKADYENLDKANLEKETGFKIFMFHTAIEEFKPAEMKEMNAQPSSSLPKNFSYYAGGHVHYIFRTKYNGGLLTFPGALYPNNFKEMEQYRHGGFYIVDEKLDCTYVPVIVKEVAALAIDVSKKSPEEAYAIIKEKVQAEQTEDKIILLRVTGTLASGKASDIDFKSIFSTLDSSYFIMKNTSALSSPEAKEFEVKSGTIEEIESELMTEFSDKTELAKALMSVLEREKAEGEKASDYEKRILSEAMKLLKNFHAKE
ncbi:MAG: DNA repair exonuclease [Candidatus Woesearchaeota archaeon]